MRRFALILLGLVLLQTVGQAQTPGVGAWACSADNVSDAANILCIAASPGGQTRYITDVVSQSTTTTGGFFNIVSGASAPADPCSLSAGAGQTLYPNLGIGNAERFIAPPNNIRAAHFRPITPIRVPKGTDICVIGDANGNPVTVQLSGYAAP